MSEAMGLLDAPIVLRLSLALVHFVWQGAVIAAIALLVLAALRRAAAPGRYIVLLVVFAAMAICPVVTFALVPRPAEPMPAGALLKPMDATALPVTAARVAAVEGAPAPPLPSPGATRSESWRTRLGSAWEWLGARLPWVAAVWMAGVLALSVRLLIGWARMMRGKRRAAVMSEARWRELVAAFSRRLRVSRPVRLMESAAARVPMVIGWLRPVVLLPPSALVGLTPEQLEAVIAHELAHVRRHDYLVNLAQTVVETLLFYHPAVWWLSSRIRAEREHCCDDLAVAVCGDAVSYARALAQLEQLRAPQLAVTARGGGLLGRVRRLLGSPPSEHSRLPSAVAAALALASLLAIGVAVQVSARASETESALPRADPVIAERVMKDTEAIADPTRADLHTVASLGEEIAASAEGDAQGEGGEVAEAPVIRRIQFEGVRELTADELLALMETKPGSPCDGEVLARDTRAIEDLYRSRGYVLATASVLRVSERGGLTLTMRVLEGEIEDIVVRGVDEQRATAMLESISTKVGDVYNDEAVKRDLAEISSLGWVGDARRGVAVGRAPGKVILVFTVTPRGAVASESAAGSEEVVYAIIDLEHMPAGYVGSLFYPRFTLQAGWPALGRDGPSSGALAELLPPGIRFISATRYDSRRLLVAGTPEGIAELRHLIAMLDREPQQVLVEVRAWPGRPAPEAAIKLYDLDKQASGDCDLRIGYASDASGDAIARAFPSLEPCAGARIALLNLVSGIVSLPQVGGLPAILLHLTPRINGDGTITMTLALVPTDDLDQPTFAAVPHDAELLATVNVSSGEGFLIVLSKGESAMTILVEPTIVDAS